MRSNNAIKMPFQSTPTKAKPWNGNFDENFHSTNVSSPVQPMRNQRKTPASRNARSQAQTQEEQDSLGFLPIRESTRKRKSDGVGVESQATKRAKKPITASQDPLLSRLTPYEQDILERFMKEARAMRAEITNRLDLRVESVFTDTELRYMGVKLPCSTFPPLLPLIRTYTNSYRTR